jgi:glycosyltransferase involved in cell wall biosynthesis
MISIIMRSKDEMPWIRQTLDALKNQSRQDFELICVDSGSTDGSWSYYCNLRLRRCIRFRQKAMYLAKF